MKQMTKLRVAFLLLICVGMCILAVSCDFFAKDSEETTETIEALATDETSNSTENNTDATTETQIETIGHSDELDDDGFIKISWDETLE